MALREVKTASEHYWIDENGYQQGEYKAWWRNGQPWVHAYYVDGRRHGEYNEWFFNKLSVHAVYVEGDRLDVDPAKLTDKEKFVLTLRYGIQWL